MARFQVTVRRLPSGISALDLSGFIDRHTVHDLDETLGRLIGDGDVRLVVNCGDLGYLSSAGIGVFMAQLIRVHQAGGDMKFYGMNRQVRTLMEVAGFSKVLEIYDTESEAVGRFRREQTGRRLRSHDSVDPAGLAIDLRFPGGAVCCVQLAGDIDRHTIGDLERELAKAIDGGRPQLVINCAGVTFLSSTGMGTFIQYLQRARSRGGDIRFCHMQDNALTVLTMLGLQNIFRVFQAEEDAVASFDET